MQVAGTPIYHRYCGPIIENSLFAIETSYHAVEASRRWHLGAKERINLERRMSPLGTKQTFDAVRNNVCFQV